MSETNLEKYLTHLHETAPRPIWSSGIALSRSAKFAIEKNTPDEIIVKVQIIGQIVSPKVELWPQDSDWHCSCNSRADICQHVIASALAIDKGLTELQQTKPATLSYVFSSVDGKLALTRFISNNGDKFQLNESLVSYQGGIQSGRHQGSPVTADKSDYLFESLIDPKSHHILNAVMIEKIFNVLENSDNHYFGEQKIKLSSKVIKKKLFVKNMQESISLRLESDSEIKEEFKNCACLLITDELHPMPYVAINDSELFAVIHPIINILEKGKEYLIEKKDLAFAHESILPVLEEKYEINHVGTRLSSVQGTPIIHFDVSTVPESTDILVTPRIRYIDSNGSTLTDAIIQRDYTKEKELILKIRENFNLSLDTSTRFSCVDAVRINERIKNYSQDNKSRESYAIIGDLKPVITSTANGITVKFMTKNFTTGNFTIDYDSVQSAYSREEPLVPLFDSGVLKGFGTLPTEYLNEHGVRIDELLKKNTKTASIELMSMIEDTDISPNNPTSTLLTYLKNIDSIPDMKYPSDLKAELRTYQKIGINWLHLLKNASLGALLADDMGLGKTLQALCSAQGRTLIIAPTSVIHSWCDQVKNFLPSKKFVLYHGTDRKLERNTDFLITTYAITRLDAGILTTENFDTIILDEAQNIKNPESQISKICHTLNGTFKIALTGTPIENRSSDLWSIFRFLNPALFGPIDEFKRELSGYNGFERIRKKVRPFILRRLKAQVAPELPPKTEISLSLELNDTEKRNYDRLLATTREEIKHTLSTDGSLFHALELLLRLRQLCVDERLLDPKVTTVSTKIETLLSELESVVEEGHKVLVFSQWTKALDLIEKELPALLINHLRLDGSTRDRQSVVESFQKQDGPPVLLMSLKAGGTGLTLTSADHIYLLDPWWNPFAEEQAIDRAHRIGQTKPVFYHRLIAKNTIEEKILELQKIKKQISDALLNSDGTSHPGALESLGGLTKEDILRLLE